MNENGNVSGNKTKKRPVRASAVVRIVIWSIVFLAVGDMLASSLIVAGSEKNGMDLFTLFGGHAYVYQEAASYRVGNAVIDEAVDELSVSWLYGDVTVIPAEGDEITVTEEYGGDRDALRLRWRVEEGELTVKFCKSGFVGKDDAPRKDLTVAIPAALLEAMDEVEITSVSGNVTYTGNADELTLNTVEGDLTVTGDIGELNVDAVDGRVIFRGGVRRGDFDCVSVGVTMYLDMAAELEFEQVDGDVALFLSEEIAGFSADVSSLDSEIVTDGFEDVRRDGGAVRWGNGSLRLHMSGVRNKLEIKKITKC